MTASALATTSSRNRALRHFQGAVFHYLCLAATLSGIVSLAVLLLTVGTEGLGRVSWDFVNSYPSRFAEQAGIRAALFGTLWLMVLTALFAVPVGIGAAIYLEEFAPRNWLTRII